VKQRGSARATSRFASSSGVDWQRTSSSGGDDERRRAARTRAGEEIGARGELGNARNGPREARGVIL
jgi:hypothetical protein